MFSNSQIHAFPVANTIKLSLQNLVFSFIMPMNNAYEMNAVTEVPLFTCDMMGSCKKLVAGVTV
jgi:ABC-type polysaccharide transport system permease subunit